MGYNNPLFPPKQKLHTTATFLPCSYLLGFFFQLCLRSAQFLVSIHSPSEIQASFFNHFIIFFSVFSSPGLWLHLCCWDSGAQQSHCSESSGKRIYLLNKVSFNFKRLRKVKVLLPASLIHHKLAGWDEPKWAQGGMGKENIIKSF